MTSRRLVRTAVVALLAVAALVASGCGDKQSVTTFASTEGIWLDAGRLDFHIQGSRVLEPGLTPDRAYLQGLPAGTAQPTGRQLWFAVFLRIENRTKVASQTPTQFEITDTEGNRFTPLKMNTAANPFAYAPTTLQPNQVIPVPDSPQDFNSFSGAMLLFKLPLTSYQNRPLEFHIFSNDGTKPDQASLDLDV
jgi:hypothetical protein